MLGLMGKLYNRRRIILNLFKGILDKFSGAVAGYSLRRLSKWKIQLPSEIVTPLLALSLRYVVVGYTGAVVRVRRTSDNAELDFNPTEITDGTLTTWTGSGDGFVTKIYNQTNSDVYTSNFASGGTAMSTQGGTTTLNESIGGVNEAQKFTSDAGNTEHNTLKGGLITGGVSYRAKFDIYIPSSNVSIAGIRTENGGLTVGSDITTTDTWITVTVEWESSGNDNLFWRSIDSGGTTSFSGTAGDSFYLKNVTFTKIDDMVQPTASLQGIIVDAGVLNTEGGKPIIHRSASNDGGYLSTFQPNDGATVKGVFYVGDNNGKSSTIFGSASGSPDYGFIAVSGSTSTAVDNFPTVTASFINGASNTPANRGVAYTATDLQFLMYREIQFNFEDNSLGLGYNQNFPVNFGMFSFQEMIIFGNITDEIAKQTNINNHYSIY